MLERQHPRIDELCDPVLGEVGAQIEVDVADQRDPHARDPQGGEHLGGRPAGRSTPVRPTHHSGSGKWARVPRQSKKVKRLTP